VKVANSGNGVDASAEGGTVDCRLMASADGEATERVHAVDVGEVCRRGAGGIVVGGEGRWLAEAHCQVGFLPDDGPPGKCQRMARGTEGD